MAANAGREPGQAPKPEQWRDGNRDHWRTTQVRNSKLDRVKVIALARGWSIGKVIDEALELFLRKEEGRGKTAKP